MAGSASFISVENPNQTEEWTVVLPRRGRKSRNILKFSIPRVGKEVKLWEPMDHDNDPSRESKLMEKMEICIQKLEKSEFCRVFLEQMQNPYILDRFREALGLKKQMQMVIYGVGSIESFEAPRLQLSLALLMKRKFDWIGEIEVFDPIISSTESKVFASLGCSLLSINEQGRRKAFHPTLFFMPHCEAELYENLLEANWSVDLLNHLVVFGNSFSAYEQHVSLCKSSAMAQSRKHILAVGSFTLEFKVSSLSDDSFQAFHGSSWQFFRPTVEADLHMARPLE